MKKNKAALILIAFLCSACGSDWETWIYTYSGKKEFGLASMSCMVRDYQGRWEQVHYTELLMYGESSAEVLPEGSRCRPGKNTTTQRSKKK